MASAWKFVPKHNHLIWHAAGSGKSSTICSLRTMPSTRTMRMTMIRVVQVNREAPT